MGISENAVGNQERDRESIERVSIVLPVFNEEALIESSVRRIFDYADTHRDNFTIELVIVDDGSTDGTAIALARLVSEFASMQIVTHARNRGLGAALRSGFNRARGSYVVVLDADLSYDVDHVDRLVDVLRNSHADMVLASPYMPGGTVRNVPGLRRLFSRWANFFLSKVSHGNLITYTCMVRAYRREFLQKLFLRANDMGSMPETVYKAQILGAVIAETPAILDWEIQNRHRATRKSSLRLFSHIIGTAVSGFMLRPFLFMLLPGFLLGLLAAYCGVWMTIHTIDAYSILSTAGEPNFNVTDAVARAFSKAPHTFVIGFFSVLLGTQLVGLAFLSLQSKKYFEDLFCLVTDIRERS